jgi:hypothetical protein
MVSLRFSSSSLAVLASIVLLVSTTVVTVIAQNDEMEMTMSNVTGEDVAGDDFVEGVDPTTTTTTNATNATMPEVDIISNITQAPSPASEEEEEEEDDGVGISNITMAPSPSPAPSVEKEEEETIPPTFDHTWDATTWWPTLAPNNPVPTITLVPAAGAEPGWADPVLLVSSGASATTAATVINFHLTGVIAAAATATSVMIAVITIL